MRLESEPVPVRAVRKMKSSFNSFFFMELVIIVKVFAVRAAVIENAIQYQAYAVFPGRTGEPDERILVSENRIDLRVIGSVIPVS